MLYFRVLTSQQPGTIQYDVYPSTNLENFTPRCLTYTSSSQLSFGLLVYPALILAYLGQGARLIVDGENVLENIFFKSIPGPANGIVFW